MEPAAGGRHQRQQIVDGTVFGAAKTAIERRRPQHQRCIRLGTRRQHHVHSLAGCQHEVIPLHRVLEPAAIHANQHERLPAAQGQIEIAALGGVHDPPSLRGTVAKCQPGPLAAVDQQVIAFAAERIPSRPPLSGDCSVPSCRRRQCRSAPARARLVRPRFPHALRRATDRTGRIPPARPTSRAGDTRTIPRRGRRNRR